MNADCAEASAEPFMAGRTGDYRVVVCSEGGYFRAFYRWLKRDDASWFGALPERSWNTANVHDQVLLPLVEQCEDESIVLADVGFNSTQGIPSSLKMVCHLKGFTERPTIFERTWHMSPLCSTRC